jgi:hypothetical protein
MFSRSHFFVSYLSRHPQPEFACDQRSLANAVSAGEALNNFHSAVQEILMRNRVLGILLFLLASSGLVLAQGSVAGIITGVVTDSQGSVIEGATITVSSAAMMKPRSQQTVTGGTYLIEQLPPGEYELTCSMPGFKGFLQKGVVLTAGFTATVKISLSLGETSETVTVTGSDPIVDVQSSSSPTTFDSNMLQNTPSGRDPW